MTHALEFFAAAVFVGTVAVGAQTPPLQPQSTQRGDAGVTVEGCVVSEADVPGRRPALSERAGLHGYILTMTKMVKGSEPRTVTSAAQPGATATSSARGAATMYKIEGVSGDDLKRHLGRRVQIDGVFENLGSPQVTPEGQGATGALVQIRGTMLRPAVGDCAAK